MALIVVHPFYSYNRGAGDLTPWEGNDYFGELARLSREHTEFALYDSTYEIARTLRLFSKFNIATPSSHIVTKPGSQDLVSRTEYDKEDLWLGSLRSTPIFATGGFYWDNSAGEPDGCLGKVIERIRRKGYDVDLLPRATY